MYFYAEKEFTKVQHFTKYIRVLTKVYTYRQLNLKNKVITIKIGDCSKTKKQ